jgi:hypothetical protein
MQPVARILGALAMGAVANAAPGASTEEADPVARSYRFLVMPVERGGVLYTATAGSLDRKRLPLSFIDDARYWGEKVCRFPAQDCAVQLRYNPRDYGVAPDDNAAGDLLTERVNTHSGTNLYDAATWQIAVVLGAPAQLANEAYTLAANQNLLLEAGHYGNASEPAEGMIRGITRGDIFVYNGERIREPEAAYAFRMLPRSWLSPDPFLEAGEGGPYASLVKTSGLPHGNPVYRPGLASWTDYKPITGENAWAFLLGPLHAARLHYQGTLGQTHVPFDEPALQNALPLLGTFAAMQSALGGVYYAPAGTVQNQGKELVDPFFVSVENTFSLYAGLHVLEDTLGNTLRRDATLGRGEREQIARAQQQLQVLLRGGMHANERKTAGLEDFLRRHAWTDGSFVQGGRANAPDAAAPWIPTRGPRAVDVVTWGIAALGAGTLDAWHGAGSAFRAWQDMKRWGGYGKGRQLLGVGFSDVDGNGVDANGDYRAAIVSSEWTAGAITAVREMIGHYAALDAKDPAAAQAGEWLAELRTDERGMLEGLETLRLDHVPDAGFDALLATGSQPYLYANRRAMVPFGWYANPLPSTCATAWRVMLARNFNPLATRMASP